MTVEVKNEKDIQLTEKEVLEPIKKAFDHSEYTSVTVIWTGHCRKTDGAMCLKDGKYIDLYSIIETVPAGGEICLYIDANYA